MSWARFGLAQGLLLSLAFPAWTFQPSPLTRIASKRCEPSQHESLCVSRARAVPRAHPQQQQHGFALRRAGGRDFLLGAQSGGTAEEGTIVSGDANDIKPYGADRKDTGEKMRKCLDREFVTIAFPAFVQFSAEPLAALVNTMYLGRLGPTALASAGVAISASYSVSKLYNDPLLRTSISLVASSGEADADAPVSRSAGSALSKAVCTALFLATAVGLLQMVIYLLFSTSIVQAMGVGPSSEMYANAVAYLRFKAIGSPGATLWLVANGVFRGLGDTVTPLKWALAFTAMNAIMDPIFIFTLGFGCPGAAMGTVVAQYIALVPLLLKLRGQEQPHFTLPRYSPLAGNATPVLLSCRARSPVCKHIS